MEVDKKIALSMILLGACARLVPHPWNFTPLVAIGLFAGAKAAKAQTGILITLFALLASDAVLGFYRGMWFIYAASLISVLIGRALRGRENPRNIALSAIGASLSFFISTNFVVWATGHMYPHAGAGLITCYVAGIPFYENQVLGDAFYTVALFGGYALLNRAFHPAPQTA